jgi:hypothetical protein
MQLNSYFNDFLRDIRLTSSQVDDLKRGHSTLRQRLEADPVLSKHLVSTFLQGSYRRATAIRPVGDRRADADVIVVTTLDRAQWTPGEALDLFIPFMEKYYKGKYRIQGRSIGITLSYVDLDVVVTSAPSEVARAALRSASVLSETTLEDVADWRLVPSWVDLGLRGAAYAAAAMQRAATEAEWKLEPLWIPNRDAMVWDQTHPLEQIRWTQEKNKACNGHYVNVVKALKWWRTIKLTSLKYPKGYPVEHLVGVCTPDGITSVAEGVVQVLEKISTDYQFLAALRVSPNLPDHGVPSHNVFARVSGQDFAAFHGAVAEAAKIARRAYDATEVAPSAEAWGDLFGSKFPKAPAQSAGRSEGSVGGFSERSAPSVVTGGRYA